MRMWRRQGTEARAEVGFGEFDLDALHYQVDARDVGDVLGSYPASTAGDYAADASAAIGDDGAGVAWGGGPGPVVKREDSPLHREIGSAVFEVVTDTGADVVGTADGQGGGIAVLDHHKTGFTVLVKRGRVTHILVRDSTL